MPWPSDQKRRSRKRILESAARLFSSNGFDNVSIADVMRGANLTQEAFYAHFRSKQELYAEAITASAREGAIARFSQGEAPGETPLLRFLAAYLDIAHVRGEQPPCPLAFLITDVANREDDVRAAYTRVYRRLVTLITRQLPVDIPSRNHGGS